MGGHSNKKNKHLQNSHLSGGIMEGSDVGGEVCGGFSKVVTLALRSARQGGVKLREGWKKHPNEREQHV